MELVHGPSSFDHNATAAAAAAGAGDESASRWRTGTLGLLAAATSVVTVGGNLIVILSFVLERTIRQPSNYFIASLAVSDLLIGQSARPFVFRLRLSLSCLRVVGSRTSVVVQYRTSRRWNFRGRIKLGG